MTQMTRWQQRQKRRHQAFARAGGFTQAGPIDRSAALSIYQGNKPKVVAKAAVQAKQQKAKQGGILSRVAQFIRRRMGS